LSFVVHCVPAFLLALRVALRARPTPPAAGDSRRLCSRPGPGPRGVRMRPRHRYPIPVRASRARDLRRDGFATCRAEFTAASPFAVTKPCPLREACDLFEQSEHRGIYEGVGIQSAPRVKRPFFRRLRGPSAWGGAGRRRRAEPQQRGSRRRGAPLGRAGGVSGRGVWKPARLAPPRT
jgi:hypothetical protein